MGVNKMGGIKKILIKIWSYLFTPLLLIFFYNRITLKGHVFFN